MGEPLENFSKEELLEIMAKMGKYYENRIRELHRDMDLFIPAGKKYASR